MTRQPRSPHAKLGLTSKASAEDAEKAHREVVDFLEGAPESVRRWARDEIAAVDGAYAAISGPARVGKARSGSPAKRLAVAVVSVVAAVAVVVGVYDLGGGKGDSGPQAAGSSEERPSLNPGDEERVAQLMRKLKDDPNDVKTLVAIGNVYFNARQFNVAGSFMQRALAVEPGDVQARLALGTTEYNLNLASDARRDFQRVIAEDPENVVAYLNLGFLYASEDPPDMANTKKMWGKVVELAPDSQVAKTVSTHLAGLEKATSAGAASPAGER